MSEIMDGTTIGAIFTAAVSAHGDRPFLAVPANDARGYLPTGFEITYGEAGKSVDELAAVYRGAGYGLGHRVAILLENRPEYVIHKLALNSIGACCVPINPDYRTGEITYLVDHSEPDVILTLSSRERQMREALAHSAHKSPIIVSEEFADPLAKASRPAEGGQPVPETPASILYTSGTTGRPKGCVLAHGYEVASGAWYASLGGLAGLRPREDRIYNPLPLYHVNSAVVSLMGAILTGNCQIQPDRFHPQRWWREVAETRATIVHYLGVIAPLLLNQPPGEDERHHNVRFGIGAGIEPQLHLPFERRFGFPLIEIWGMTEMVRVLGDSFEPRQVGTRAFGRAVPGIEVRVVDDGDRDVADGQPGEMLVRHSAATPRRGFFSGYLKDDAATESVWRGGWFHTGDVVWRGAGRNVAFRRSQEEHHSPIGREHRRGGGGGHPADAPGRAASCGNGSEGRATRRGGVRLRRAEAQGAGQGGGDGVVPTLLRASRLLQSAWLDSCRRHLANHGDTKNTKAQHISGRL